MLYAMRLPVCSCAPAVVLRLWCAATVIGANVTALAAALDARVNASNVRLAGAISAAVWADTNTPSACGAGVIGAVRMQIK